MRRVDQRGRPVFRENWVSTLNSRRTGRHMYHTTGFSKDEIVTLCAMITEYFGPQTKRLGRKQALGLFKAVVVTLCYLRRNHVQQELGELFGTSQSTISRTVARYTTVLGELLKEWAVSYTHLRA